MSGEVAGVPVRVAKPQTYMNRSGAVLAPLAASAAFEPSTELLVLVDDADLMTGTFRLRGAGSPGGHNGLKSIEEALGHRDYARLRIGVGPRPAPGADLADYVLDVPDAAERAAIRTLLDSMTDAVECWLSEGIERAMTRYNR